MKSVSSVGGSLLVAVVLCLSSCQKSVEPGEASGEFLYTTSFESDADTVGWWGYGGRTFRYDAPPGGGERSLVVSGGCIIPHACVDLPPLSQAAFVSLRCWGKALERGGAVTLELASDPGQSIFLSVLDSNWTPHASADSLFCPANEHLRLSLRSGGIVAGAMAVDLLEVIRTP
jgi:hypothetical protein